MAVEEFRGSEKVSRANFNIRVKQTNDAVEEVKEWSEGTFSNPNLLINGGFEVWQRGTSFEVKANQSTTYTADRWKGWSACGSLIEKTMYGLKFISKINPDVPEGNSNLTSTLEINKNVNFSGKRVTLSSYCKGSISLGIYIVRNSAIVFSSYLNISNTQWKLSQITVDMPVLEYNDYVVISLQQWVQDKVFEAEYVKLELGSVATPFVPRHYGEELALCQRYCRKLQGGYPLAFINGASVVFQIFSARMRIVPTIKLPESAYSPVYNIIGGGNYTASDFTILTFDSQGRLYTAKNNTLITDITLNISLQDVILDAEIY